MRLFMAWVFCLAFIGPVVAQVQPPDRTQTEALVLAEMSQRLGVPSLTRINLATWNWRYGSYAYVRGFGCDAAPASQPVAGGWQRFELSYRGVTFVYLIADNAQNLILCNEAQVNAAIVPPPTATVLPFDDLNPTAVATAPSAPIGVRPDATPFTAVTPVVTRQVPSTSNTGACRLAPRLRVNSLGQVTPGEPNWVHANPVRTSEKIGEIPGGERFTVIAGPICDASSGMNYWQVSYQSLIGWTSEGLNGQYWTQPLNRLTWTLQTASSSTRAGWLDTYTEPVRQMAFSQAGRYFVVNIGDNIVDLWDAQDNIKLGSIIASSPVTALAYSYLGERLAIAGTDNTILMFDSGTQQTYSVGPMANLATTLAFSPADNYLVAASGSHGVVSLWDVQTPTTTPLATFDTNAAIASLEFSADGLMLVARDVTGLVVDVREIVAR